MAFTPSSFSPNVVDDSNTLSNEEIKSINARIQQLRDVANIQAAVYITPSLQGNSIEEAADATFKSWQLGEKGKDNGILLIFGMQERRSRIEVGYGLEGEITDMYARRILDQVIMPLFKQKQFGMGIEKGLMALAYIKTKNQSFLDEESILQLTQPMNERVADEEQNDFDFKSALSNLTIWLSILFLTGPLLKIPAFIIGRLKNNSNPALSKSGGALIGYLLDLDGGNKFVKPFLAINPGIFIFLSNLMAPDSQTIVYIGLFIIFLFYLILKWKSESAPLFSNTAWKRQKARIRLNRIRTRVEGKRIIFGKSYSYTRPTQNYSSSSRSSSSSSSSGGGRSGGGGASSSW